MSELVSSLGLWIFPVVGLIAFLIAFAIVFVRAMHAKSETLARQGALPLDADEIVREGQTR